MKTPFSDSFAFFAGAILLLTASLAEAHSYGVSSSSYGRGTTYTSSRGGSAYVGPRGAAAEGANGRSAAVGERGAAYSGPNGAAAAGRYGSAAVGANGAAYASHSGYAETGRYGAAYSGSTTAVAVHSTGGDVSAGYIRYVPAGSQAVVYGGYNCYNAGGVYYRPVFYGGTTVYVVVP